MSQKSEKLGIMLEGGVIPVISVGSALVDKKAVAQAQFEVITRKAEQFIEEIKKARGK